MKNENARTEHILNVALDVISELCLERDALEKIEALAWSLRTDMDAPIIEPDYAKNLPF